MSYAEDFLIDGPPDPPRRKPRKGKHCATPGCWRMVSPYIPNTLCYKCEEKQEKELEGRTHAK